MAHTVILCDDLTKLNSCRAGASIYYHGQQFDQGQSANGEYWLHIADGTDEDNATYRLVDGELKFEYSGVEL